MLDSLDILKNKKAADDKEQHPTQPVLDRAEQNSCPPLSPDDTRTW